METFLGIAIGIIATVIISQYYFKKGVSKKLTPYFIMSSNIFSGVDDQLRKSLKFFFHSAEINDLQQIELLIANNGEKAISHFIEPLTMTLPDKAQILDASILYKSPNDLEVNLEMTDSPSGAHGITFIMPLLNKGDYFFIKCLVHGKINPFDISFRVLAEDIPRSLTPAWLPPNATKKRKFEIEWAAVAVGFLLIIIAAAFGYALYLLQLSRPDIFPLPWKSFHGSIANWLISIIWAAGCIVMAIFGIILSLAIGFEKFIIMPPKFPLPDELHSRRWFFDIPDELIESKKPSKPSKSESVSA